MFGTTVANSGSVRHSKFVENTEDMMVKVHLKFILPITTLYS